MEYRTLGGTGISVSRLCCGGLTVGPVQLGLSVEAGGAILAEAFERGVSFVDTGQLYKTYPHIRWALDHVSCRDSIVIASKAFSRTAQELLEAVDEARSALGRDVIDIFHLHGVRDRAHFEACRGALDMLLELKQRGVVRAVGISTHSIEGVRIAIENRLDVVHPLINLSGWGIADGEPAEMAAAIKQAHDSGIGVYAMKALGGGNLHRQAARCFDYVLDEVECDSVAVGMSSREEVRDNVSYFERRAFTESYSVEGKRRKSIFIEKFCVGCGKCVQMCHQGALKVENSRAVWESEKCVLCGYCATACPGLYIRMV